MSNKSGRPESRRKKPEYGGFRRPDGGGFPRGEAALKNMRNSKKGKEFGAGGSPFPAIRFSFLRARRPARPAVRAVDKQPAFP